jgi:hypothetical protein
MGDTDGFTLIDYIKSSIEILMNMKIDENDNKSSTRKPSVKKNKQKKTKQELANEIPKIDFKTPTSSILDL